MSEHVLMTVREVAAREKVNPATVRKWVRGIRVRPGGAVIRLVPDRVVGTRDKFTAATVDRFMEQCREEKHGPIPERVETPAESRRRGLAAQAEAARVLGGRS